jgi:hypothetical protein
MTEWYGPHRLALVPVQETELDPMACIFNVKRNRGDKKSAP